MAAPNRVADAVAPLGTLADGVVGTGLRGGLLRLDTAGIEIDWWIGADDSWKFPVADGAHTIRPGIAPAIETRARVPGGEMVLRAYAVAAPGAPLVVVDLENASPGAAVVAWVVRAAPGYRIGRVVIEGSTLLIDERARVELPRVPSRWAVAARDEGVREAVVGGNAASGPFQPVITRRGDLEVALLFPIAHRTRTRIAAGTVFATPAVVAQLPAIADVERGWSSALEPGMQVELPDEILQAQVDVARATVLLAAVGASSRDRVVAVASMWGLADGHLPRTRAVAATDPWPSLRAPTHPSDADWLRAVRDALVHVTRDRVAALPHFPGDWLGRPVAVHDAPTAQGPVSFAVRWHGERPALLWEVPEGLRVCAPGLDASWESTEHAGEALLGEIDPTRLLPLHTAAGADRGVVVDEPESFT